MAAGAWSVLETGAPARSRFISSGRLDGPCGLRLDSYITEAQEYVWRVRGASIGLGGFMGLRFQKRIRIFKGLTLNLSKSGTSWTVGGPGASVNLKDGKATGNVGIPGNGISYRERLDVPKHEGMAQGRGLFSGWTVWGCVVLIALILVAVWR